MQGQNQLITENLYEIPSCSICLNELTEDLSSLACGHVFHISCITQHFQYKGTCPNCQKRAQLKEIRLVVYPVVHNTKAGKYLRTLIGNIDKSSGQQMQGLLLQIKVLSERSEKLEYNLKQGEKELSKKNEQLLLIKREIEIKQAEVANLRKQNTVVNKQLTEQKFNKQKLHYELIDLREKYDVLLSSKKQIQHFKAVQKMAAENSEQLVKYKNQLESLQTPPQAIVKSFFEMLQLKNLNILKMKQKQKQYAQKFKFKEEQNAKLRSQIQILKKQIEQHESQTNKWKGKYEKVRDRYKEIMQKNNRAKSQENMEMCQQIDDNSLSLSIGLSNKLKNVSSASDKMDKPITFNIMEKPKQTQTKFSFGNQALKRQIQQKKQITLKNFMS